MATLTSAGIGSGLDVSGIVSSLVGAQQAPYEARVAEKKEVATNKITSLGSLVSAAAAFQDAAEALNSEELFQANTVSGTSSNYTTTVDSTAVPSSYSVEIKSLAQGQKLTSRAYAEDSVVGAGTMEITVNGSKMSLTFDGTETISVMKDMINDAVGNPGVTASIITDDTGQHLVLNSKDVGLDNTIEISVVDDDGDNTDASGLSAFNTTTEIRDVSGKTAIFGAFSDPNDLVGDGTLDFQVGTTSFSIVTDGLSLSELALEITDVFTTSPPAAGDPFINPAVIPDADGNYQLYLYGNDKITITATDSDGNNTDDSGISVFAFDPITDGPTKGSIIGYGSYGMSETQAATDAVIVIDGSFTVSQSSNVFKDAIEGVTITATTVSDPGDSSTITIAQDNSKVGAALATFSAAYNSFLETTLSLGRVNVESGIVGSLVGESLLRTLSHQVRDVLGDTINTTSGVNSLVSLGFTIGDEGLLKVDESVMAGVVNSNFEDVKNLFVGDDGIMGKLSDTLSGYTGAKGAIQSKIESYKSSIVKLEIESESFSKKMVALESRLLSRFNAMDLVVGQLNSTGAYLTAQLNNLPGVVRQNNS